jgi:hypothetical protein
MPKKNLGTIRDFDNYEMLARIKNKASLDYKNRIPDTTKGNLAQTLEALTRFPQHWNEFTDALVNRIGTYYTRDISWKNPLAAFKRGMLTNGDSIEEVQTGLINSYEYSADRDYMEEALFAQKRPNVASQFHTVNRQEMYKITVNRDSLRRAFLDENGLETYISQILAVPTTSDQWDEFLTICSLFAEYQANGGFWHEHCADLQSLSASEADAKALIKMVQAYSGNMTFISRQYNAARMETFARPENLVVITTPEVKANIGVEAWAAAFNVEYAQMKGRFVEIPKENFGIDGAQALLTTKDFFVICDNLLENQSQINPAGLYTNYFLHHWEIISASLFVPAVLFWTGQSDNVVTIKPSEIVLTVPQVVTVSDSKAVSDTNKAQPGRKYIVQTKIAGKNIDNIEFGLFFNVLNAKSQHTRCDNSGVLTIGADETAASIQVAVTLGYVDPATGKRVSKNPVSITVPVDDTKAAVTWPRA